MTNQTASRKNIKLIIIGIAVLAVVGFFAAKMIIENKIKTWATEDLSLYEPLLKLESAKVEASWFGSSVTYKDVTYSMPEAPGVTFVIGEMIQSGIDGDTLMGKPGETSTIDKISLRDMRVLLEGYEKPVMEIGHYEVHGTSFPYRDIRAALIAHKGSDDIMGLLGAMFPILRDSKMKSGASRMSDFKINMSQLGMADLSLGLATASGFRELNQETDGFDGALDNATYKNFKVTGNLPDGSELLATIDSFEINGFKFNYRAMFEALAGLNENSDPLTILAGVLPSLYNYGFDEISVRNLSVSASGALFTLEKINLGPRTLKEQGPNSASNIKLVMNGMNVFGLETIGLDKLVLSDTIVDFINDPGKYLQNPGMLMEISENPLMALRGTALENLHITNLDASGLVKLNNWRSDVAIDESIMITSRIDTLHVSNIGLRQAAIGLMGGSSAMQNVIGVLVMNPSGLTLNSGLDLEMLLDSESLFYDLAFDMTAKDQGALAFAFSGMTGEPKFYETYGEPLFDAITVTVEDNGVLNNIYKFIAMQGLAPNAEAARDALLDELESNTAKAGPHEAALVRGIKSFMLQGGKLSINLAPEDPAALNGGALFDSIEDLNLSVTHSK